MVVVEQCIKLIDDNFFFKKGEREKWDNNKKKLLSDVMAAESHEEVFTMIDDHLIGLNDPHTRLLFKETPSHILPYDFIFNHKKLYLECEEGLRQITYINQESVQVILDRYSIIYKSYPLVLIENELLKDIQFMKKSFSGSSIQIAYDTGYEKDIYPVNTRVWMRTMKERANGFQLNSVYVWRVDEDCICIQIITFRDRNVVSQIIRDLGAIKGKYKTIIFDVRNNTGGYIEVAKELVSKIIDSKVRLNYEIAKLDNGFVKTMPMEIQENTYYGFQNKQILVFVNYRTMSSAEYIFANALQLKGFPIIGEETAGLTDQATVIPINEEIALQVTTKRYMKNGEYIQNGLIPNVFIKNIKTNHNEQKAYMEWYTKNYM